MELPDYGDLEEWRTAGRVAATALQFAKKQIEKGASILDVSERVDAKIIELGAQPAWPVQINANNIAAHYCAIPDDPLVFSDELFCVDIGVHINGAIGDNALSVDLSGQWTELVNASREALNAAIKVIAPGVTLGAVGKVIQETIESYGFTPVHNLSGHGIRRNIIHAPPTIPNIDNKSKVELIDGLIVACEPFATNGVGSIHEVEPHNLFRLQNKKPVRHPFARELLQHIEKTYPLVFTTRNLLKVFPAIKVHSGLRELVSAGILDSYGPLVEDGKGMVSQAEHTIRVGDKNEILTTAAEDD